jgi:hypothetical protein
VRLALLLHHDDGEREFSYDREFRLSPLADALDHASDYGITVVSMKRDWERIFSDQMIWPSAANLGAGNAGLAGRSHESGDSRH